MIFWTAINIITALAVAALVVYMLGAYDHLFRPLEKLAMVTLASMMVLRIGPILGTNLLKIDTPYDGWSVAVMHISILVGASCILGRMEKRNGTWRF